MSSSSRKAAPPSSGCPPRAGGRGAQPPRVLTLPFFEKSEGRYLLRPGPLNSYRWTRRTEGIEDPPAVPDAAYLSALRGRLDPRRLRDFGFEEPPAAIDDAVLAVAATGGIVTNPAFLDIVDDLLVRSSCMCCYYTRSRSRAGDAEDQIRLLLGYYAQASYETSTAFYRILSGLLRDISPAEAAMISYHVLQGPQDHRAEALGPADQAAHDGAAALCRIRGVCAVHVSHARALGADWAEAGILSGAGVALCVYSTAEGRKLLRRLGKVCKAAGLTLTTRVATSSGYGFFCLRHKLRLYAPECHAPPKGLAGAQAPLDVFWGCVGAVARLYGGARAVAARPGGPAKKKRGRAVAAARA